MRVQHNIAAMNSYRNYNNNTKSINKNLEKLSSGYKINRAGDDAAGLAISEKMRAQISGLEGAQKNAKDGISLVQTAEGALTEVHSMLNRMYTLAEQSANGTYDNTTDRYQLNKEVDKLRSEIDRIAESSNFNGQKLLDGSAGGRSMSSLKATANGILDITASGGGKGDTATDSLSATLTNAGNVKLTFGTAVAGVEWKVANGDSAGESSADLEGAEDGYAGSVTFKAVVDYGNANLLDSKASMYDGMTVTVRVDRAAANGQYAGGTVSGAMSESGGIKLQIGDTADTFNQLTVDIGSVKASKLSLDSVDISSSGGAAEAMQTIKDAINQVSDIRGELGATQNRLEHTINNLSVMQENIQDAESTIRDTDVADEMMKYTKNSILVQSAQAMLAQANQQPQGVLQLLQ
jgi:flagellin